MKTRLPAPHARRLEFGVPARTTMPPRATADPRSHVRVLAVYDWQRERPCGARPEATPEQHRPHP